MEGALKIKEMCYLHAEGYSGGALKHGPFALIEDENGKNGSTPIILLILDDHHANHMRTCAEEVRNNIDLCNENIRFILNFTDGFTLLVLFVVCFLITRLKHVEQISLLSPINQA